MDQVFGPFRLDCAARQLIGPAGPVELSARSFDILARLLDRPDEVVGKDELLDAVWPGQVVGENTLQVHVSTLRRALGDGMIMTVHGRGYKYAGPRPAAGATGAEALAHGHRPVLVVLPFVNLGGEPDQQFFVDGIAADVADRITRFRMFAVIGQHSAASFRAADPDVPAIRDRLRADFVVSGSVRRAGDRLRVTVRLTDAASEEAVWADRYDRPIADIFSLQDEISELVAAAIARHLEVEINVRSGGRSHANLSSYEHLLQGYWHFKKLTAAGALAAEECFQRAIACDTRNAEALAWLGAAYCERWVQDFRPEGTAWGVDAAERAVALDPASATSRTLHAWACLCAGDREGALAASARAMSLNPGDPAVLVMQALALGYDGRTAEARDLLRQAHRLEPVPPLWFGEFAGIVAFAEGRYHDTLAGVEPIGESAWDNMYALACYGLTGEKPKARALLARLAEAGRHPDWALGLSREAFRDPAVRERLAEGLRLALGV